MQNNYYNTNTEKMNNSTFRNHELFSFFYQETEENSWNAPLCCWRDDDTGILHAADAAEEFENFTIWSYIDGWYEDAASIGKEVDDYVRVIDAACARRMAVFSVKEQVFNASAPADFRSMTDADADRYATDLIENIITDISRAGGNVYHLPYLIKAGAVNAFISNYIRTADIVLNIAGGYVDEEEDGEEAV